jgi:hypothetical protein
VTVAFFLPPRAILYLLIHKTAIRRESRTPQRIGVLERHRAQTKARMNLNLCYMLEDLQAWVFAAAEKSVTALLNSFLRALPSLCVLLF